MKLAEALIERADLQKRLQELRIQITSNLQVEEGEKPEETVKELMRQFEEMSERLTSLVDLINRTNSQIDTPKGKISYLLARRDSLAQIKNQYQNLAGHTSPMRYGRSKEDVKYVLTFSPKEMRKKADALAKEHRELDTFIQGLNWTTELL